MDKRLEYPATKKEVSERVRNGSAMRGNGDKQQAAENRQTLNAVGVSPGESLHERR